MDAEYDLIHKKLNLTNYMLIKFNPTKKIFLWLTLGLLNSYLVSIVFAVESQKIITVNDKEFNVRVFPAQRAPILIWLPSEIDHDTEIKRLAEELNQMGIETWLPDLLSDLFLPQVTSSLSQIPPETVAGIMQSASEANTKVFLVAEGDGVVTALRAAMLYRKKHVLDRTFAGVILVSGKFFLQTPDPGQQARWFPIVQRARLPIFLLQPEKSPWYWTLKETQLELQSAGSVVTAQVLNGLRDRFYFRPDATPYEIAMSRFFSDWIANAMENISKVNLPIQSNAHQVVKYPSSPTKKTKKLQPYSGLVKSPGFKLQNLHGEWRELNDYRGKVLLVNFWASWCPPCVHEIPSLNMLGEKFENSLTIVGINMGEDPTTISDFLKKVDINFSILLDREGRVLKKWQVYAFPTSFLLSPQGEIKYAVVGAIDWLQQDVSDKILSLQ